MSNTSYFNPAFENQYLESELFDGEIFEDREFGNPEGMAMEGLSMENPEMSFEDGETWESGNMEGDRFFGGLLRKIAPQIAQSVGGALAGPTGANIARQIASTVLNEQQMEYSGEFVGENETQLEAILEASGVNMEILGEMAHYAELAAETNNEQEADRFFGAIANLAGQILPGLLGETQMEGVSPEAIAHESIFEAEGDRFLPLLGAALPMIGKAVLPMAKKLLPHAVRGLRGAVRNIGRSLWKQPRLRRRAVRALPRIAIRTAQRTAQGLSRTPSHRGRASVAPARVNQIIAGAAARPIVEIMASPARLQYAAGRNRYWRRFSVRGEFTVTPR